MSSFLSQHKLPIVAGILMLVVLPLALFLSQTPITAPRAAVDKTAQSKISLSGPQRVAPDQSFTVDIVVDTSKDPEFYLSGIDALINYDPETLTITQITDKLNPPTGLTLTTQTIDPKQVVLRATATGIQTASQPTEFTLASLTITPKKLGKTKLSFVYTKPSATDDTNLVGYKKDKPIGDQVPRERLLSEPPVYNLSITTPASSPIASGIPTPSCFPRPACLDETPIICQVEPLPPGSTYCPPSPKPSCLPRPKCLDPEPGQPVCQIAPAPGTEFCPPKPRPSASPTPTTTPTPTPSSSLELQLSMLDRINGTITGTLYGVDVSQVQGVSIAQGFGSISSEANRFVPPTTTAQTIATFTTNQSGRALVDIPAKFQGKTMWLYARTISHLVKKSTFAVTLSPSGPTCKPGQPCPLRPTLLPQADFVDLIPGDIYIAPRETEQDNVINSFDAAELIKHLGKTTTSADLNADGTVNTRDLQILLTNLGKTGDPLPGSTIQPPSPPKGSGAPIVCPQVYSPVCCNGKTYSNSCEANAAEATNCKPGTCKSASNSVCPDVVNKVCASDGQTYNNECEAQKKGLYWTRGTCSQ